MDKKLKNDFEENDYSVEEVNVNFSEKQTREIVTNTIDYSVTSLARLISKGTIDLNPSYQRRLRWNDIRQSKLIESFFMNVPVPPIFLNEDSLGKYSVIDGKQRLLAISEFLSGNLRLKNLEVYKDLNGAKFSELPVVLQDSFETTALIRAVVILRQSDKDIKHEVFQRLNTGGVHLNPQEIRNNAYPGLLNNALISISENEKFHNMLGIKSKENSRLYQEMKDAELVLRFFALKNNWKKYAGGLKGILDDYMDDNQLINAKQVGLLEKDFFDTIEKVEIIFGQKGAYRRWLADTKKWKQQVSAPLFDAQMFSCYKKDKKKIKSNKEKILKDYKKLFSSDETFLESIASSTGSPDRFLYRTNQLNKIIKKYT